MSIYDDPYLTKEYCKCCGGTGVQENKITGLRQPCPYCYGTGKIKKSKPNIYGRQ